MGSNERKVLKAKLHNEFKEKHGIQFVFYDMMDNKKITGMEGYQVWTRKVATKMVKRLSEFPSTRHKKSVKGVGVVLPPYLDKHIGEKLLKCFDKTLKQPWLDE